MNGTAQALAVLVVGAGMAGLVAARELRAAEYVVRVVDKGRGVGGRLATRRSGAAVFDHGAQFLTAGDPRFAGLLEDWREAGVLEPWGAGTPVPGRQRWRGRPSMTAVAKHLATGLDPILGTRVTTLERNAGGWRAACDNGVAVQAAAVILTAPVPQALELLAGSGVDLPTAQRRELETLTYDPCLAAMVVLDGPSHIPAPGCLAFADGPVAWLADNQQKGVSAVPAVTIHASPAFSRAHWDSPREESAGLLVAAAAPWLGARVCERTLHGWRYARPACGAARPFAVASMTPLLLLAGDAFGGPDAEGAALSGWAAAAAVRELAPARA